MDSATLINSMHELFIKKIENVNEIDTFLENYNSLE